MKRSKPIKILVGIGTLWYALYPILFIAITMLMILGIGFAANMDQTETPFFMVPFFAVFPLHCLTILLGLALMVFYIIHLIKNKEGSETARILLGLGFFFLPLIAMPFYYFVYIWPNSPPAWALAPQVLPPSSEVIQEEEKP